MNNLLNYPYWILLIFAFWKVISTSQGKKQNTLGGNKNNTSSLLFWCFMVFIIMINHETIDTMAERVYVRYFFMNHSAIITF